MTDGPSVARGSEPSAASVACPECGCTAQERLLGMQMVEMLAGASERAKAEAKPDDPVRLLRRMSAEFGYDLTALACGAPAETGPCTLPKAHNMGRADIPQNHRHEPSPDLRERLDAVIKEAMRGLGNGDTWLHWHAASVLQNVVDLATGKPAKASEQGASDV